MNSLKILQVYVLKTDNVKTERIFLPRGRVWKGKKLNGLAEYYITNTRSISPRDENMTKRGHAMP